jgi:hypothetical protein
LSNFKAEHRDIEETFLSNGFRPNYITEKVNRFFEEFNASRLKSHSISQDEYTDIRHGLFEYDQQ